MGGADPQAALLAQDCVLKSVKSGARPTPAGACKEDDPQLRMTAAYYEVLVSLVGEDTGRIPHWPKPKVAKSPLRPAQAVLRGQSDVEGAVCENWRLSESRAGSHD